MTRNCYERIQNTSAEMRRLEAEIEAQTGRMTEQIEPVYVEPYCPSSPGSEQTAKPKRERKHPIIFYVALVLLLCSLVGTLLYLATPMLLLGVFALRSLLSTIMAIAIPVLLVIVLVLSR